MDARVQGLHAPVEHLREMRDLLDERHRDAGLAEGGERATSGDEFPAEANEAASEGFDT